MHLTNCDISFHRHVVGMRMGGGVFLADGFTDCRTNYKVVWYMFPEDRIRTLYCLTYLTSFENAANLSFCFLPLFLGRTDEFKTLSMTPFFKAEQASLSSALQLLGPHSLAMQCRLSLNFLGFYLLHIPQLATPPHACGGSFQT